jgi:hypothetical protein
MSFLDDMLGGKINKEAIDSQGANAADHFDRKVKAHDWIKSVSELDPVQVDAEYQAALAAEAKLLGKTAAYEIGETSKETIDKDFDRDIKILSDYALAEMLAELRCSKEQNTQEMFHEAKEKAKKEVASSREKAEKALLELVPEHTMLDWQKAFDRFSKEATPEQATEKDLYQPIAPEASHEFEKPTEDKFKVPSEEKKADVMIGVGREADERTEATKEAGVLQESITEGLGKVASVAKKAMIDLKVSFDNGDSLTTGFNGTEDEAKAYYMNNEFNLGDGMGGDAMTKAVSVEVLPSMEASAKQASGECSSQDMILGGKTGLMCANCGAEKGADGAVNHDPKKNPQLKADMNPIKREEMPSQKQGCPVCGSMEGTDLKNGQMDHMACEGCGITYSSKTAGVHEAWDVFLNEEEIDTIFYTADPKRTAEDVKRDLVNHDGYDPRIEVRKEASKEIQSHASKKNVLKKVAEVESPWKVMKDENGQEVIARVGIEDKNIKESEEATGKGSFKSADHTHPTKEEKLPVEKEIEDETAPKAETKPEAKPEAKPADAAPAPAVAPVAPVTPAVAVPAAPSASASTGGDTTSPTRTNTETGGSSPGGASTGGVGSGIGGAGTGGAATGGASTGGAGTVTVNVSGGSGTNEDGGKASPVTINISNVGGNTGAGEVTSGDGPGSSGTGGKGDGSGGGGGGAAPDEPRNFSTSGKDEKKDESDPSMFSKDISEAGKTEPAAKPEEKESVLMPLNSAASWIRDLFK